MDSMVEPYFSNFRIIAAISGVRIFRNFTVVVMFFFFYIYGSQHDKTNKMTCVPSEDSDQPGHPP